MVTEVFWQLMVPPVPRNNGQSGVKPAMPALPAAPAPC